MTTVSVHVAADGVVHDPKVAESSGNADLDKAAVACLMGARIRPIKKSGTPIEADTQVKVIWRRSFFTGAPIEKTQSGCQLYYPALAMRLEHEGDTLLSFTIAEDGTVKKVTVAQSSGHDELDQASITCVSNLQFRPVSQNGRPVTVDSEMRINWRLR